MMQKKIDLQGLFVKLLQEYMGGKKTLMSLGYTTISKKLNSKQYIIGIEKIYTYSSKDIGRKIKTQRKC